MEALGSPWVRIAHFLGIDKGTFFAILGKMWGMGAGFVTTLFIAAWFTSELQGYYYTFISVLALQVFAEMGLGGVIGSYASHEWAKLSFGKNGELLGDAEALSRLNSLGRFALKWYVAAGVLLAVALVFGGFIFFASTGWEKFSVWGGPWLVLCILTGINLFFIPVWALLEGCNQVESIYFYRFIQSVMSSVAAWAGIYMGAGLWTCALVAAVLLLVTLLTVVRRYRSFIRQVMFALPLGGGAQLAHRYTAHAVAGVLELDERIPHFLPVYSGAFLLPRCHGCRSNGNDMDIYCRFEFGGVQLGYSQGTLVWRAHCAASICGTRRGVLARDQDCGRNFRTGSCRHLGWNLCPECNGSSLGRKIVGSVYGGVLPGSDNSSSHCIANVGLFACAQKGAAFIRFASQWPGDQRCGPCAGQVLFG